MSRENHYHNRAVDFYFALTHRENRYLLFLTENYAALEILKQYLQDQDGQLSLLASRSKPGEEQTLKPWEMEPFVLFGSSFPKDKEYTQVGCSCFQWLSV